ncbi:uncharacterized protein G2W53_013916 [Senna tora]|uniref:Uncharacterized protein n=1 Tax=Senna tora TaxID=362788 RepID=A0A834TZJ0_9FABA|nr:uncharacterized protein G2W53_013916 [Senna tora]
MATTKRYIQAPIVTPSGDYEQQFSRILKFGETKSEIAVFCLFVIAEFFWL